MIRKLVLLVILLQPLLGEAAPTSAADVVAVSKCGRYRLKLTRSSQAPSPWDTKVAALSMSFDLAFLQPTTPVFLRMRPEGVYLENEDPLVSAHTVPVRDVAKNKHSGWTDNFAPSVTVHTLELGAPLERLHSLVLAVTLVRVTSWENVRFSDIQLGSSDFLKCGPFQILVRGEKKRVMLSVGSFSQFRAERKEYRKRMPLRFLNHSYGIKHTSVRDARGRDFFCPIVDGTGGSSSGVFLIQAPRTNGTGHERGGAATFPNQLRMSAAPVGLPIVYPLSLEVRLPKQYRKERVVFTFADLPLPALEKKADSEASGADGK